MNRTIFVVGIALLMLGFPASAKESAIEDVKPEIEGDIGVANASCPLGDGVHDLADGESVTSSLPSSFGASCEFSFTPAAGADLAQVVLSGLQSDFDLYIKVNAIPTTSTWDCRPYSGGTSTETCSAAVSDGDYVGVMVRRYSGSGSFTVTATSTTIPVLENGVPVEISLGGSGQSAIYKLIVPEGATLANFVLAPADDINAGPSACAIAGSGIVPCTPDADMYVRAGSIPTTSAFDCRPYAYGNTEGCTFSNDVFGAAGADAAGLGLHNAAPFDGAGKYFVMVRSYAGAPHVVLQGATA